MKLRISIVTPSKNNASTLERTILSIKNQNDTNLQYIIVDGASDDGTYEIVNRHRDAVTDFISEPDNGQYDAISKGFSISDGDIMAWINADDIYYPWTFSIVREIFTQYPDVMWLTGLPTVNNDSGQCVKISRISSFPRSWISSGLFDGRFANYLQQESMFWRRSLWEQSGGLRLRYNLAADFDLWTRFAKYTDIVVLTTPIGGFTRRNGAVQRSIVNKKIYMEEIQKICQSLSTSRFLRYIGRNRITSELYRQFYPGMSRFAVYDMRSRRWKLVPVRMAVSQLSIVNYFKEWMFLK